MADLAFAETSPWAGTLKRGRFGSTGNEAGVSIAESTRGAMGLIAARKGSGPDLVRAAAAAGLDLPTLPRWVKARDLTVLWAGPGQWLVRRPGSFTDLESQLSGLAASASLIDQSHARAALTVSGPKVRDALAKGFEIDLHPRAFRTGDVAVTAAVGIAALIWQLDDRPTYEIAVPRSMAGSFWDWLSDAAAEYGYAVRAGN